MAKEKRFKRWSLKEADLKGLNPVKARDLIVKCFYEAQKETFAMAKERLGLPVADKDIHMSVVRTVKSAFGEVGGDYENPTKESLSKIVKILLRKAKAWGTPKEIMDHNKGETQKVINLLKE